MKRVLFSVAVAGAVCLAIAAQDAVKFAPEPKVGDQAKYNVEFKGTLESMGDVEVTFASKETVSKVAEGKVEFSVDWTGTKMSIGGSETGADDPPTMNVTSSIWGAMASVNGGPQGFDAVRFLLAMRPVLPEKELAKGQKETSEYPKPKADAPSIKMETEYLGVEEVAGQTTHVIKQTLEEKGTQAFKSSGKYWLKANGVVVKGETTFENIFVEGASAYLKGTIKLTAAP